MYQAPHKAVQRLGVILDQKCSGQEAGSSLAFCATTSKRQDLTLNFPALHQALLGFVLTTDGVGLVRQIAARATIDSSGLGWHGVVVFPVPAAYAYGRAMH